VVGITHDGINVAGTYDRFTHFLPCRIEALVPAGMARADRFVGSGAIRPGGKLPMSTHGGLFSLCSPQVVFAAGAGMNRCR
jgi:hypothetical protein